jgi:hypothetical protein
MEQILAKPAPLYRGCLRKRIIKYVKAMGEVVVL